LVARAAPNSLPEQGPPATKEIIMDQASTSNSRWTRFRPLGAFLVLLGCALAAAREAGESTPTELARTYADQVRPLLAQHCLKCHSTKKHKGDLDLERFTSLDLARKDVRVWQGVLEMLENGEMPPKKNPQPPTADRQRLVAWVRDLLDAEARARAGDPGRVVLRRLSNAEYNNTVRDLTGVDLQPARDFPVDGAAGEGFTNAGDALVTSPTLLNKYLNAAKEIAAHAVLLPEGFRFSSAKTRRDWTNEIIAELQHFYAQFSDGGKLPLKPYLLTTVQYRKALTEGRITVETVAAKERLNSRYLQILWRLLNEKESSFPLDEIRADWRLAEPRDVDRLVAQIAGWQDLLWRFVLIGSYRYGNTIRQLPNNPPLTETQTLRLKVKPAPGQNEVVLYLSARGLLGGNAESQVVWRQPRLEGDNKPPLLLRDYSQYGPAYEVDYRALFADTARYVAATLEAANNPKRSLTELARAHGLDAELLGRWNDLLELEQQSGQGSGDRLPGRRVPVAPLVLLDAKLPKNDQKPAINGWVPRGSDLPVVIANASDVTEYVPGRVGPHHVAVHPTPTRFVAVLWESPLQGRVRLNANIVHAHPGCGNGVTWWLECRRADQAAVLADGVLNVGKAAEVPPRELRVRKGDQILLAVDPRDADHACDLTEVALNIVEVDKPGRAWNLGSDIANTILQGNPHPDKFGNRDVWRFVHGPARKPGEALLAGAGLPARSILDQWRQAASDPKRQPGLAQLAQQVQTLLAGPRPTQEKHPDRLLYDLLVSLDGRLLCGINLARLPKNRSEAAAHYGLDRGRFTNDALVVPANSMQEVRLPAALFRDHVFVVEGRLDPGGPERVVQFRVLTAPPQAGKFAPAPQVAKKAAKSIAAVDGKSPFVISPGGKVAEQWARGLEEFRRYFPQFTCYARVIPDDEVVCLKLYHREDEPLIRLFLDEDQNNHLDRLWAELRFISQFPVTENKQLPLFIGFVTQDQPKELLAYFEGQRGNFRNRAEDFEKELLAAVPRQLDALVDFAGRAYRRPLQPRERQELLRLYATVRDKGSHDEAFRTVLTRALVSPSFLFRVEQVSPGNEAERVSSWELATRLSYFLWATMPDAELCRAAVSGHLQDAKILEAQVARMLKDPKVRGLAVEFATQWLHVRDIEQNHEKNEKLFPTFNDELRQALNEEGVRFFQYLFQEDRPLLEILDADYTFLNGTLARHYGISGISGPEWRRVAGVKKDGRGGVLALGSVLTKESGASRTSPVLRGNWLVETMLGEKLPKPPPNVPRLPEEESAGEATVRQMVEKHAHIPECYVCHQRIDPFGFALEKYDPLGRYRAKDLGGRPIDTNVQLKDGTKFEGIDGLRNYLSIQRRDEFQRHFCQKLLGYALGRSVGLSDQPLLDEMLGRLKKNDNHLSAAVLAIVESKQFRYHRGREATKDE